VQLGIGRQRLTRWRLTGRITARICSDLGEWLYWLPPTTPDCPSDATVGPAGSSTARGAL
jgi:hypothetical protein